jgi:hypothetical protein
MTDPNSELVARLARRGEEVREESLTPPPTTLTSGDWNAPIDSVQADCLSLRNLVRGWIGDAKDEAWRWEPRPCPPRSIALPKTEEMPRGR